MAKLIEIQNKKKELLTPFFYVLNLDNKQKHYVILKEMRYLHLNV